MVRVIMGLLVLTGFFIFGLAVVGQFLMLINRKPGVKLFQGRLLYNPFSMQFKGKEYLTEKGIYWRNLSWMCFAIFWIAAMAVGVFQK